MPIGGAHQFAASRLEASTFAPQIGRCEDRQGEFLRPGEVLHVVIDQVDGFLNGTLQQWQDVEGAVAGLPHKALFEHQLVR